MLLRENIERLLYFMGVLIASTGVGVFLMVKIFPAIRQVTGAFGVGSTSIIDSLSAAGPLLLAVSGILLLVLTACSYLGVLFYIIWVFVLEPTAWNDVGVYAVTVVFLGFGITGYLLYSTKEKEEEKELE